ncbi:AraC family transcriptional regulator [Paenibacillus cymbidii]|uniref:AraC family transcriptional regulator n=1 Tax=Paenibacillus cymbidii TaxID=1639034 RepID=UPI0010806B84|nr:AraC family transcriptional regulator [Paenibacillus cymbidii]
MAVEQYRSKDQLDASFPFKILRYASRQMQQLPHMHEYTQVAYVLRGLCCHRLRGKTLVAGRGDAFVIHPGNVHSFGAFEEKEYELVLIDCIPSLAIDLQLPIPGEWSAWFGEGEDVAELQPAWLHIGADKRMLVEQLLQDMQEEYDRRESGFEWSIRLSLLKLLHLFVQESRNRPNDEREVPAAPAYRRPIEAAIRHVNEHYSQDIPLERGAQEANMAPAYFSHLFRKETGQTFVDYLHEVRIERAMELMRRGDEPVTHICYQVGFRHLSHFIRTFKKRTGLTPTAYKQTFGAKAK